MKITHVIRGNDHLSNTPKQLQCYAALGLPVPVFAHIPMILGADKSRLSKRHGATSVQSFRDAGMLPEAMVNHLARLGWSHGDQEIFSREELIRDFDLGEVGKAGAVFEMLSSVLEAELPPKLVHFAEIRTIALRGKVASRPIFEVMSILGKPETLARLRAAQARVAA